MPLPAFSNTYSFATHTRGFYFQAPQTSQFLIVGLRVPDETMHGTQNVEVMRFSGDPTMGAPTTTQAFFSAGQPSANIISCSVLVNPGEWIGVLGACGDPTIMHNSYGPGGFTSDVLGAPVTLNRLYCQSNIAATGGNQPVVASSGSLARVEVYVAPPVGYARSIPFGDGCGGVTNFATYYESFSAGAFDLGGSPGNETVLNNLNAGSGLVVLPGAPAWFTPTSPDLGLSDDAVSTAQPLGFTLNLPGGVSTTDVYICSNGFIWLQSGGSADYTPSASELVSQGPRICMLWQDLNPATGGTIHFDTDPANGVAYVTWLGVPAYNNAAATVDMQCAIFSSGNFEMRYSNETISTSGTRTPFVGFTPGLGVMEPPVSDLSVLPIFTQPDQFVPNLSLSSTRPVEGASMAITVDDIPSGTALGTVVLSPTQVFPGMQPFPGLGSCMQFVGLDNVSYFLPTGSTQVINVTIPSTGYTGVSVFAQAVTLSPGVNPLGVATSNGLEWVIDAN